MNITHIINLFRAYLIENKKILLIYCLATFALAVLGSSFFSVPVLSLIVPYLILIWVAGTFFQSSLKKNNCTHFFNLPVTTAEKFTHAVGVILVLLIALAALLLAGTYIGTYFIRPLYIPITSDWQLSSEIYKMVSWDFATSLSVFLFGSIYFKKNSFIKTWGTVSVISIAVIFYFFGLIFIVFGTRSAEINSSINIFDFSFFQNYYYLLYSVVILFFLSLTYLRLKETEV